jgi:hypothetical protein
MTRTRFTFAVVGTIVLVLGLVAAGTLLYARIRLGPVLAREAERMLADRFESDVQIGTLRVALFPEVRISGDAIVLRHEGRTDVPPLVAVDRFEASASLMGLLRRPRHVQLVRVQGLRIHIPPDESDTEAPEDERKRRARERPPSPDSPAPAASPIVIARIEATNAELVLIPRRAGKRPKTFLIHDLGLDRVATDRPLAFAATLTNPTPEGRIDTTGEFGPWAREHPGRTPVSGKYTFSNANLNTIEGIGGTLTSTGTFTGLLQRIEVDGRTETPDFSVDVSGLAVPLTTTFHSIVDGTNGDTLLEPVEARFLSTALVARGGVVDDSPGVKGRTVRLDVERLEGRIEDLLRLAVDDETPLMTGDVTLKTTFLLPPVKVPVVDRLVLDGEFGVESARFTDPDVQKKLGTLSNRAQGNQGEPPDPSVLSNLRGRFVLKDGELTFRNLTFGVPGAQVRLSGRYGLRTEALAFRGTLRLEASISRVVGGKAGFFLRIVDPLFRKHGAGTVLPITITGTRKNPQFGVDVKKVVVPGD